MPKPCPDIAKVVLSLLEAGPVRQVDICHALPLSREYDVGPTVRDMAARGIITREKAGATYILRKVEG